MSDDNTAVTRSTGNFASRLLSKAIAERAKGKTSGEFQKPETLDFSPPAEEQAAVTAAQASTVSTANS